MSDFTLAKTRVHSALSNMAATKEVAIGARKKSLQVFFSQGTFMPPENPTNEPSEALKRDGFKEINGDGFVSRYSPTRTERKKELQRLLLAQSDVFAAHKTSDHFLHIITDDGVHKGKPYAGMGHPLYSPLVSAMVVTYAKPFVRSDTVGQLKKEWGKFSNSKWDLMHQRILKARNEMFAHNDGEVRRIKILPPREITLGNMRGKTEGIGFGLFGYDFSLPEIRTFAALSFDLAKRLFTECNSRIEELYGGMELPQKDFMLRYDDGL